MTHTNPHPRNNFHADGVLKTLWVLTALLIAALVLFQSRLTAWVEIIRVLLGASLWAMGFWQIRRLTAHGWWKGRWRATLFSQNHEEWMALLVAVNVMLIGLVCMVVAVSMGKG